MSEKQYDLVVLGGGTAGYVAAIRASQLGKKSGNSRTTTIRRYLSP